LHLARLAAESKRRSALREVQARRRVIKPKDLNGIAALKAAESTPLRKKKDERDTEFVKRIVAAYMNAVEALPRSLR
jgi:hypothetical protein